MPCVDRTRQLDKVPGLNQMRESDRTMGEGAGWSAEISIKLQFRFRTLRPMQKGHGQIGENHIFQRANKSQ